MAEKYTFFPGKELSARLFAKHSKYMRTIRTIVNLPEGTPFPRCPCKSRVKVRQFEEKGDQRQECKGVSKSLRTEANLHAAIAVPSEHGEPA